MEDVLKKILEHVEKITPLSESVDEIRDKVNHMWDASDMDTYLKFPPLTKSNSPITLTSIGEGLLNNYYGKEVVDANADEMIAQIEKKGFKSPLDVQTYSEKLILLNFNSDAYLKIKNHIYYNPVFDSTPVSVKTMATVMGIYLRDKYLKMHKELEQVEN